MPSTLAESGHVFISWFKLRSSTVDRTLGFRSEDTVVDNLQCRYNAMVESICLFISEPFVSSSLKCFSSQNFRFASAPLMDLLYIFYICSPDKTAPKNWPNNKNRLNQQVLTFESFCPKVSHKPWSYSRNSKAHTHKERGSAFRLKLMEHNV